MLKIGDTFTDGGRILKVMEVSETGIVSTVIGYEGEKKEEAPTETVVPKKRTVRKTIGEE